MKAIVLLLGLAALAFGAGCESDHHRHHDDYRGGAYDRSHYNYGRGYYENGDYERYPGNGHYYDPK